MKTLDDLSTETQQAICSFIAFYSAEKAKTLIFNLLLATSGREEFEAEHAHLLRCHRIFHSISDHQETETVQKIFRDL